MLQSVIYADTIYSASLKSFLFYKGLRNWSTVNPKKESFKGDIHWFCRFCVAENFFILLCYKTLSFIAVI